jgi:hypothetical protein
MLPHLMAVSRGIGNVASVTAAFAAACGLERCIPAMTAGDPAVVAALDLLRPLAERTASNRSTFVQPATHSVGSLAAVSAGLAALLPRVDDIDRNAGVVPPEVIAAANAAASASSGDLLELFAPEELVQLAAYLFDTQGSSSAARTALPEFGPDALRTLLPDGEAIAEQREAHASAFYQEIADYVVARLHERSRSVNPAAAAGFAEVLLRLKAHEMAMQVVRALLGVDTTIKREHLWKSVLRVMRGMPERTCDPEVTFLIKELCAEGQVLAIFDACSTSQLKIEGITAVFVDQYGIPPTTFEGRFGCPGKTPPLPCSGKFNTRLVKLAAAIKEELGQTMDGDKYVLYVGDAPELELRDGAPQTSFAAIEVPAARVEGTYFERGIGAIYVTLERNKTGYTAVNKKGAEVVRGKNHFFVTEVRFADGSVQRRNANHKWERSWHDRMAAWRAKVLTRTPTEGGAPASAPATEPSVTNEEVAAIEGAVLSIKAALDKLPQNYTYESEYDSDEEYEAP